MNKIAVKRCFCSSKGFTLIELLVVVLIIGILAAVAVPQYQLAVKKARFSQMQLLVDSMIKTLPLYYLEHGTWPEKLSQLDITFPSSIDLPVNTKITTSVCGKNDAMYCCFSVPAHGEGWELQGSITCGATDYSFAYTAVYASSSSNAADSTKTCREKKGEGLCLKIYGVQGEPKRGVMLTPDGWAENIDVYSVTE